MMLPVSPYPGYPAKDYNLDTTGLSEVKFGREIRKEFGLDPNYIFFNHGSYGTVPNRVLEMQHKYNREREENPEAWFRINARIYVDRTRKDVAKRINACVDNVMIVENATTAINSTLRAYPFKAGDAVLDTTITYGSIQNLCIDFTSRTRPDVEWVRLHLSTSFESEDDVIKLYEDIMKEHPNIKVAIIDHITSISATIMPVSRLCHLLHSQGVLVIVDGAHTFGHIPLDMEAIGGDVYISNIHKWSYSPRGAALLWFSEKCRDWIRPPNTSWQVAGPLDFQFFDNGTRDHVPFICARHSIQFYDGIGGMEKIISYTSHLANECKNLLQEIGLEPLAIPSSMEAPNMKFLKLPPLPKFPCKKEYTWVLQAAIFGDSKIFGNVIPMEEAYWIRISTQVYTDMEDVKALVKVMSSFLEKNREV